MREITLTEDDDYKTVAFEFIDAWQIREFSKQSNGEFYCESAFSISKDHIKELAELGG